MTPATISASELRTLLEQGRPLTIVDIRRPDDREWTIPGSVTVDAYDAVNAGQLGAVAELIFDSRPAVMVCGRGGRRGAPPSYCGRKASTLSAELKEEP